jgi:hypothetical protein
MRSECPKSPSVELFAKDGSNDDRDGGAGN